jgi:hypothetical protein
MGKGWEAKVARVQKRRDRQRARVARRQAKRQRTTETKAADDSALREWLVKIGGSMQDHVVIIPALGPSIALPLLEVGLRCLSWRETLNRAVVAGKQCRQLLAHLVLAGLRLRGSWLHPQMLGVVLRGERLGLSSAGG